MEALKFKIWDSTLKTEKNGGLTLQDVGFSLHE
jgi:hypothetical protein